MGKEKLANLQLMLVDADAMSWEDIDTGCSWPALNLDRDLARLARDLSAYQDAEMIAYAFERR